MERLMLAYGADVAKSTVVIITKANRAGPYKELRLKGVREDAAKLGLPTMIIETDHLGHTVDSAKKD